MKKLLALLATVFYLNTNAQTLNFFNLSNMHFQRGAIATSADNNYIYVSNGFSTTYAYTKEIEKYDINSDTWSVFTNSLIKKRYPTSVIVDTMMYLFDGVDSSTTFNAKMEAVNLNTGVVTLSTNNPVPAYYSGAAVWNGLIYVFGGSTSATAYTNKLYSFNPVTHVWTPLANMPQAKQTKGEIINGKLYVLGGYNGVNSNRIDMYDIASNTWTNLGLMSDSISSFATAVSGSTIYLIGDYNRITHLASYDVSTNTYTVLPQTNMIGRRNAGAAVVNNTLYITGGNQTSATSSSLSSLQFASLPTGIKNISTKGDINIYPNPAQNNFTVEVSTNEKQNLMVYDVNGKQVLSQTITGTTNIDASNLNAGVYNISITNSTGVANKRLVIVK